MNDSTRLPGHRFLHSPGPSRVPEEVQAVLRADVEREIVAVFIVHTDTASGITNDLPALRAAIDRAGHPALFVVDVVASLAAAAFAMDATRINVVVGASQKALMV